jgi:uncharacterized membrane protein
MTLTQIRHQEPGYSTVPGGMAGDGRQEEGNGRAQRSDRARDRQWIFALGCFSIGLGLAELLAPRQMARLIGIQERGLLLRSLGLREVASGVGLLTQAKPAGWMWSRVAGDAMDLALLGSALRGAQTGRGRAALAATAVTGVMIADILASRRLSQHGDWIGTMSLTKTVTINRPAEDLYRVWRRLDQLPRILPRLQLVQMNSDTQSHWSVKGPGGSTVEWDAEITEDRPNEIIAWRSSHESTVRHAGSVRFKPAPGDRGTEVTVSFAYDPPGGAVGTAIASLFGDEPGQQIQDGLRAFKQAMETGEVVHSDASIHQGPHPARPPERSVSSVGGPDPLRKAEKGTTL